MSVVSAWLDEHCEQLGVQITARDTDLTGMASFPASRSPPLRFFYESIAFGFTTDFKFPVCRVLNHVSNERNLIGSMCRLGHQRAMIWLRTRFF